MAVIQTERFLLRKFKNSDLENVYRGLSNPDVIRYYGISYDSREATKAQLKWFDDAEKSGTGYWWAICSRKSNEFFGAAGLYFIKREFRKGEVGFWLFPEYWGKGIIQEVVPYICDYAFNKLSLHRIEAFVESENTGSKKALERLHFQYEGTMRDCEIKNGRFISLDIYAKFENSSADGY